MKKFYSLTVVPAFLLFLSSACSKDYYDRYEDRIEGTWRLTEVYRIGSGRSTPNFPFVSGEFTFHNSGRLTYVDISGIVYEGSWDIYNNIIRTTCHTDEYGNERCEDREVKGLDITAIDFTSRDVRTEHFDEIIFNRRYSFEAHIHSSSRTYVFVFRKQ